jgi:hypothetical protein
VIGAGGAAAGGGLGGLGALMTNPWTIAIGAGIAGAFGISKLLDQTRKHADEFVQQFQNPFAASVESIIQAERSAQDQGELTADQAEAASQQVQQLWDTMQTNMNKFASQNSKNAKVVQQAFDTLNPYMQQVFAEMTMRAKGLRDAEGEHKDAADKAIESTTDLSGSLDNLFQISSGTTGGIGALIDALGALERKAMSVASAISLIQLTAPTVMTVTPPPGTTVPPGVTTVRPPSSLPPLPIYPTGANPTTAPMFFVGSFAQGGMVPQDGLAFVHKGEMITPPAGPPTVILQIDSRELGRVTLNSHYKWIRNGLYPTAVRP